MATSAATRFTQTTLWPRMESAAAALQDKTLWGDLGGEGFDAGGRELEADQPIAGDAAGADFRGSEFPAAEGFLCGIREILAGPGILEVGRRNVAGGVHVSAENDADSA